ncbi:MULTISPECIES: hypothetical protein [Rhizobium]|uniref:5-carboxymethyl-2-hydroxymuconate isomerase n=3 Tax=Rhizobium TaxID=379 RepID=A0A7W6USB0_9HYPH|nr:MULTISPECIES: hypothetical protein [Rhizobium]MBB4443427.1 hypothetical protein [Rhizobium esperanzae]MBB5260857.1 hypothetical protein [Rhizobium leguminosarum]MDH6202914.1 hypothetical protein [Rhizobium leguminosarum]MDX6000293.1 hypothetical protein [Rhizobium leguminosarum]
MPNMKIYVDRSLPEQSQLNIEAALVPLSKLLCERLDVNINACQFAVIPVYAMANLPAVNLELFLLPKAERTRQKLMDLAREIQQLVGDAAITQVAVRISQLDPATFIALK